MPGLRVHESTACMLYMGFCSLGSDHPVGETDKEGAGTQAQIVPSSAERKERVLRWYRAFKLRAGGQERPPQKPDLGPRRALVGEH